MSHGQASQQEFTQHRPTPEWTYGSLVIWLELSETTGGMLSMAEVTVRKGGEPPLHVHSREDELFYVLDGEVLLQRGMSRIEAGPGTSVWLPRGVPHGFAVQTETARLLNQYTPAGLEKAHRSFAKPAPDMTLPPPEEAGHDLDAITAEFAQYGVAFVGPPLPVILAGEAGDQP